MVKASLLGLCFLSYSSYRCYDGIKPSQFLLPYGRRQSSVRLDLLRAKDRTSCLSLTRGGSAVRNLATQDYAILAV
jgi:hypothetical protein